jgi:hypothetical protein
MTRPYHGDDGFDTTDNDAYDAYWDDETRYTTSDPNECHQCGQTVSQSGSCPCCEDDGNGSLDDFDEFSDEDHCPCCGELLDGNGWCECWEEDDF